MKRMGLVFASIGTAALLAAGIAGVAALATGESPQPPPVEAGANGPGGAMAAQGLSNGAPAQEPPARSGAQRWGVFSVLVGDDETRARRAAKQRDAAEARARETARRSTAVPRDDDDDDDDDD